MCGYVARLLLAAFAVLPGTALATVSIDSESFSFAPDSTAFAAVCDAPECVGVPFTPEVYAGDGVTVLGFGAAQSFTAVDEPMVFTVEFPGAPLQYETPYFASLSENAGEMGGGSGEYLHLFFGNNTASETCAGVTVYDHSFRIAADTFVSLDDLDIVDGCGIVEPLTGTARELVYAIQLPTGGEVELLGMPEEGYDIALYVVTDCGDLDASCVAASDAGIESAPEQLGFAAAPGQLYYVVVDGNDGSSGLFILHGRLQPNDTEVDGEGEGVEEGEGEMTPGPPLVIGFVAPSEAVFNNPTPVFIGATFSDDVLENTGSLSIRFTDNSGQVDLDNDDSGVVSVVLNSLVGGLTPVRAGTGTAAVYLTAVVNNEVVVSNTLPFSFILEPQEGEALDPFEQLLYAFAATDTDSDGRVNIVEILLQFPGFTLPELELADANGDNQLTVAELLRISSNAVVHSMDSNGDYEISLAELLRVIQFYNADAYACAVNAGATEDGYLAREAAGGDPECPPHASDLDADGSISLSELLRAIQLFSLRGYQYCSGQQLEDAFCAQD